jgi:hypothetical protein
MNMAPAAEMKGLRREAKACFRNLVRLPIARRMFS